MVASAELQDLTDDQFDMIKSESSSEFPVSVRDSFLSTNVNVSSLKLVLDWLADRHVVIITLHKHPHRSLSSNVALRCIHSVPFTLAW